MSDPHYNIQLAKLCEALQLGQIIGSPVALSGGLMHKMYAVTTSRGRFVLKALNPQIMLRPTARQNYINSERIARLASCHTPALPAKECDGLVIHEIDHQAYLLFDWVDGHSLSSDQISTAHCREVGAILAAIHMTDFSALGIADDGPGDEPLLDWRSYLQRGRESNSAWVNPLAEVVDELENWNAQANRSARLLASDRVISHRDLDPKNILWNHGTPLVIDWEAAGYINPLQELTETAIYWSESAAGEMDQERFLSFIGGYQEIRGTFQADWRTVLFSGLLGKLGWLEYSLKRSLWMECTDAEEQQLGTTQAVQTISSIQRYAARIPELVRWLSTWVVPSP